MGKRNEGLDIARVIREARVREGLTQIDLAKEVGVDNSTVSGWEGEGERKRAARLQIERTVRLLRVLKLNPAKLA